MNNIPVEWAVWKYIRGGISGLSFFRSLSILYIAEAGGMVYTFIQHLEDFCKRNTTYSSFLCKQN